MLVNSNPATIMTDPGVRRRAPTSSRSRPRSWRRSSRARARPTRAAADLGGQTALELRDRRSRKLGILDKYGVEMIGATAEAIDKAEDRELFKRGDDQDRPRCRRARHRRTTLDEALATLRRHRHFPPIIRPSLHARRHRRRHRLQPRGVRARSSSAASTPRPTSEVLIEESVLGWKEFEMEVMRDNEDNCVIICSIENFDPMGVHTGDSITVAPALTLTDKEYQMMRDASIAVMREIGVETGGSNVQFAVDPARRPHGRDRDEPARLALLGAGLEGDRLSHRQDRRASSPSATRSTRLANDITGGATPASFEPTIDYVVDQDSALHLREVSRRRPDAHHVDEIGRRGDGDRPHLRRSRCRRRCARWRPAAPASTRSRSRASARATTRTPFARRSARRRRSGC